MRCLFILFCGALTLYRCHPEYLTPDAYVEYIRNPKNGFVQQESLGGITVEAFYQPPPYTAIINLNEENTKSIDIQHAIDRNAQFYQFLVSIRSTSNLPIDERLAAVNTSQDSFRIKKECMMYRMQNCFTIVLERDSLPCIFYQAQPTGKIDNAYHFIVVFESDSSALNMKRAKDWKLLYRDSLWFHRQFEFVYNKQLLENIPQLKL